MRRVKRLLAAAACLLLVSCTPIDVAPAKALRDAVAPEHMAYVQADPKLSDEQKARRARTWQAFDVWIKAVEAGK